MKFAWLLFLPLLFAPNFGMTWATLYGVWEFSDYLVLPFIAIVGAVAIPTLHPAHAHPRLRPITVLLLAFVVWALLATLLVPVQYESAGAYEVRRGLLKLGKLLAYGLAGILVAHALTRTRAFRPYVLGLVASGVMAAAALFFTREPRAGAELLGFKAANAVSVAVAMLLIFLVGFTVAGRPRPLDRRLVHTAVAVMFVGMAVSGGRGGWLAAAVGMLYISWKCRMNRRLFVAASIVTASMVFAWYYLPEFQRDVLVTIAPPPTVADYSPIPGFDEGARVRTWTHEIQKLAASPVLGTGFFHRGGASGLWTTGSHNFWLQMFLETGIVGGLLVLGILGTLWQEAGKPSIRTTGLEIPVKAALLTAIVGGMGGEYFYGGMPLLAFFLVAAPALAMNGGGSAEPSS